MNSTNGLLFAGDLLVAVRDPSTGVFGGYERLQAGQADDLAVSCVPRWPMTELPAV